MAGGAAEDIAAVGPLSQTFSKHVVHCGPRGSGQMMKIINNVLCHANAVLTGEACHLGIARGMDLTAIAQVMEISTGRNFLTAHPEKIPPFYSGFAGRSARRPSLRFTGPDPTCPHNTVVTVYLAPWRPRLGCGPERATFEGDGRAPAAWGPWHV